MSTKKLVKKYQDELHDFLNFGEGTEIHEGCNAYGLYYNDECVEDALQKCRAETLKEIFDKFDEYACIKNDAWYKEFKQSLDK